MKTSNIVEFYLCAKATVFDAGYADEYEWQLNRKIEKVTEHDFLEQYAWVVLNCGFRENVVRRIFPFISMVFFDFVSANKIAKHGEECVRVASVCFANEKKLRAIVDGSATVATIGFKQFMKRLWENPNFLRELPFIGSITIMHLLKNLGADVAKNDRHLSRLSGALGFSDASQLCSHLAAHTGESISTIDVVLWRFCALKKKGSNLDNYH